MFWKENVEEIPTKVEPTTARSLPTDVSINPTKKPGFFLSWWKRFVNSELSNPGSADTAFKDLKGK
jgi:hypothetical protein